MIPPIDYRALYFRNINDCVKIGYIWYQVLSFEMDGVKCKSLATDEVHTFSYSTLWDDIRTPPNKLNL